MYKGPVIDLDVHHNWTSDAEVLAYLPETIRESYKGVNIKPPSRHNGPGLGASNKRLDAYGDDGSLPGTSYEVMRRQLLDPHNVTHAVLGYDVGMQSGLFNSYFAAHVCRAANEWTVDRWLSKDSRLYGGILVPTVLPTAAAEEIRRAAKNGRMIEILFVANGIGRPFGHPFYDPIYEAAVEVGLPVAMHLGSELGFGGVYQAGAAPMSRLESFTTYDQPGMAHAASLLTHGVFEKFPTLKVAIKEYGFAWLPWLMWKLDSIFPVLRRENEAVTQLPSEIFQQHCFISTQPFDCGGNRAQFATLLESCAMLKDVLCFATDYPHWDADEPSRVAQRVPADWHEKFFYGNAARFYGLKQEAANETTRQIA